MKTHIRKTGSDPAIAIAPGLSFCGIIVSGDQIAPPESATCGNCQRNHSAAAKRLSESLETPHVSG